MKILAGLSAVVLSCAAGCAFEGIVIEKRHEPAERRIQIYDSVVYDGTSYVRGKLPVCIEDDEDFVIVAGNGKERKIFYMNNRADFDKLNAGDKFAHNPQTASEHDPPIKRRLSREEYLEMKK